MRRRKRAKTPAEAGDLTSKEIYAQALKAIYAEGHERVIQKIKIQHGLDFHRQLVQGAMDNALRGLTALFMMNGLAATAALASGRAGLGVSTVLFAGGAFLAALCFLGAYLINHGYADSWLIWKGNPPAMARGIHKARPLFKATFAGIGLSLLLFGAGLALAAPSLL